MLRHFISGISLLSALGWIALKILFPEEGIAAFCARAFGGIALLGGAWLLYAPKRRLPAAALALYAAVFHLAPVGFDLIGGTTTRTVHDFILESCDRSRPRLFAQRLILPDSGDSLRISLDTHLALSSATTLRLTYWRNSGIIRRFDIVRQDKDATYCSLHNQYRYQQRQWR